MESLKIGQMELATPILAAATSATARLDDLRALNRSAIGAIITKSATLEARAGNPETNYFSDDIKIIGTGGVQNAETAQQYFQAGADAVAIGTGLVNHGPRLVENIIINL